MRLLLDTHALIWWLGDIPTLSAAASGAISQRSNVIFVSAASAWEIATKYRIGKLPLAAPMVGHFAAILSQQGFFELPISIDHGDLAGSLKGRHRDPFDRILVAQALSENLTFLSNEKLFDQFNVKRLW